MVRQLTSKPALVVYPILWAVLTALAFILSPDMDRLVTEEGQIEVPSHYPTEQFDAMIGEHGGFVGDEVIVAYHDEDGITQDQADEIEQQLADLQEDPGELPLNDILTPFDGEQQAEQLFSDDEELLLAVLELEIEPGEYQQYRDTIEQQTAIDGLTHYQTGAPVIEEDVDRSIQEGLETAQWITIGLVFLVLFSVFRSPFAPVIPLVLLATSYVFAVSVVAFFVEWFGFPVSNYTQIFIMAVVFGVGTDYCILLMRRFQEELPNSQNADLAMRGTFRASTKTVAYGAFTGFIGFATIGFAEFDIYQSAVGVAVAMVVLVIGLAAFMPSMMALVGRGIFWPSKPKAEAENNRFWAKLGSFSIYRPGSTLLIIAAVLVPLFWFYDNDQSFDSVEEIDDDYDSVEAYDLIADTFGEGDIFYTTLAVESPRGTWEDPNALPYLELMAVNLEKVDGVDEVRTVTRPEGDRLEPITVPEQAAELATNLQEAIEGVEELSEGHQEMLAGVAEGEEQLAEAEAGVAELIEGTDEALTGVEELEEGLTELADGLSEAEEEVWSATEEIEAFQTALGQIEDASPAADEVEDSLADAEAARQEALGTVDERQEQLDAVQETVQGLAFDPETFETGVDDQLEEAQDGLEDVRAEIAQELPGSAVVETIDGLIAELDEGGTVTEEATAFAYEIEERRAELESELQTASEELGTIGTALDVDTPLDQVDLPSPAGVVQEVEEELGAIQTQVQELATGLSEAVDGLDEAVEGTQELGEGLRELQQGHEELAQGLGEADEALDEFDEGLREAEDGTSELLEGLTEMESFVNDMAEQPSHPLEGIYIDDEMLEDEQFDELWEHYATPDDHVVSLIEVTMEDDPYSQEAIETVDRIEEVGAFSLEETPFDDAALLVDGVAAENRDLNDITNQDFLTTATIMLIGIFLALCVLFRSLVMPVYVLFSLVATYFGAAAITEWIFTDIVGYQGLMWAVPFFGFVLLMALGVDYSIFLLMRFNETSKQESDLKTAMLEAMKKIGGTILSAAFILGGTFASMMASGVLTLLQISTLVVLGLLFYSVLLLPLFVPAVATLLGSYNWWPLRQRRP